MALPLSFAPFAIFALPSRDASRRSEHLTDANEHFRLAHDSAIDNPHTSPAAKQHAYNMLKREEQTAVEKSRRVGGLKAYVLPTLSFPRWLFSYQGY